ncbi:MAG: hypothetical protein ACHQ2Y_06720 [Candidatus Lutacidiplasmatales archaeon]
MGEAKVGQGRTNGYRRPSRLLALGSGSALTAVALMMVVSPLGMAAHASVVIHPPFSGAISPSNSIYVQGCGKVATDKQWSFKLGSGFGGTSTSGSANACKHSLYGVGTSSSADVSGGIEIAIPVKMPAGSMNVTLNTAMSWSASLKVSDGSKTGACSANLYTYAYSSTYYEWNYNGVYFLNYNDTYSDYSNGIWYNGSYGTTPPSPFNLNNTTYYSNYQDYGASGGCTASATAEVYGNVWMVDESTGSTIYSNNSSIPGYQRYCYGSYCYTSAEPMYVTLTVTNYTDWYCYQDTYWYGPSNYTYNYPLTCYSYNKTLTTYTQVYTPGILSSSCGYTYYYQCTYYNGTGSATWSNSSAGTEQTWFNDSFTTGDHYAMFIQLSTYQYASQSWTKGSASWVFNMLTLGHGFRVTSISAV